MTKGVLKFSRGSGKMEGIPSINTSPFQNEFCMRMSGDYKMSADIICRQCYSIKMLSSCRKNAEPLFAEYGRILSRGIIKDHDLPRTNHLYARFSSHGELINHCHYFNLTRIAVANPDTTFCLFTKRSQLIAELNIKKPENLMLVYSARRINLEPSLPGGFERTFTPIFKDSPFNLRDKVNCGGKCLDCLRCWRTREEDGADVIEYLK